MTENSIIPSNGVAFADDQNCINSIAIRTIFGARVPLSFYCAVNCCFLNSSLYLLWNVGARILIK